MATNRITWHEVETLAGNVNTPVVRVTSQVIEILIRNKIDLVTSHYTEVLSQRVIIMPPAFNPTGKVFTVATLPGATEDEVWVGVTRNINGTPMHYIERLGSRVLPETLQDSYYLDCGTTGTFDTPSDTITGLTWLEGQTVTVLGDGKEYTGVVSDGSVTIDDAVTDYAVGLAYTSVLKPMRIDIKTRSGDTFGEPSKITEFRTSFFGSADVQYGADLDTLFPYDLPADSLFTGEIEQTFDGGFDPEDPMTIVASGPFPCTIRAIAVNVDKIQR
jgi:hypothetical protein